MKARVSPTDLQRDGPAPERAGLFVLPENYKKTAALLVDTCAVSPYIQKVARINDITKKRAKRAFHPPRVLKEFLLAQK